MALRAWIAVSAIVLVSSACNGSSCTPPTRVDAGGSGGGAAPPAPELGTRPTDEGWEVVDPYCGMKLRRTEAAATMEHRGRTYYFCLPDHRDAFARDPDRYLSASAADAGASDGAETDPDASANVDAR